MSLDPDPGARKRSKNLGTVLFSTVYLFKFFANKKGLLLIRIRIGSGFNDFIERKC
jgi:hypothetical protein